MAAILATDEDSGTNGEVTYVVSEDDEDGLFFLNPVTGVFNLTRALDYEAQQFYILTVQAEDGGGQWASVRAYFSVLDVNDNAPVFGSDSYSTSVMENLPVGSAVLVFNASDSDAGERLVFWGLWELIMLGEWGGEVEKLLKFSVETWVDSVSAI